MTTHHTPSSESPNNTSRFLALVFILLALLMMLGCPSGANKPVDERPTDPSAPGKSASDFDGERAFEQVRKQVEFGPRPAGSAELEKTRNYLIDQLKSYGLKVTTDEFQAATPIGERKIINVIAELPGESTDVIVVSSHYDTKLFKEFKFVGANDAGSSTGALLEIARVLAPKQKPRLTYWFVFFDGEEAFCREWDDCHNPNPADPKNPLPDNTYGSRHFVAQLLERNELKRVKATILLDIVGYKNLRFGRDEMSTAWLQDIVWQTAKQIGYGAQFIDSRESVGDDDHAPFLRAGLDALDIIQLSTYPYWHTKDDTLDKISAKSLKIVGDTVIVSLPKIEERLARK
ncbi:MAG TPA: M28 family metallopeptidase [Pyrinomonadaceae bacterium]|nr:M28 family metallopeptidase [Pyrinomonadaceae bacterium]